MLLHPKFTVPLMAGVPSVMVVHGADWFLPGAAKFYSPLDRAYMRVFMPLYVRKAAAVIAVSQITADDFERLFRTPAGKVQTVYFGPAKHFRRVTDRDALQAVRSKYNLPQRFVLTLSKVGGDTRKNIAGVFGAYQELRPERFPERLGGWYRVDRWEKSAETVKLYIQAVVIVTGDPRAPALVAPGLTGRVARNYQLRYYLAGLTEPAFHLRNAHVVFEGTAPPRLHEWIRFEVPLGRDIARLWAGPPAQYESLRVLFEARWDAMPAGSWARADVYFDDLYLE